ncbi:transcriptional regulator, AraC family [Desulfofarcimen acetoxidans DSM 771]|uniref:Transcriptional regulator, AraC family n=1 Tax=Desulfofarcimen acetoxidans (strain ATCC 49208 / DSM 771 / KCTC 5769 / VKM B-1644 / 5575) TaxID=485916 RepID=C8VXF4_DESAS|nr:helix-turn-helix domain-containing protein [Desulfofarcimen acetoxidans]ACV64550.1 transcriptional regulator, AraC family [Desulfofarcimen acetoxidans DSM 771]
MFDYMTVEEAAEKWGITGRRVQILCRQDKIPGSIKKSGAWFIPQSAQKPSDPRLHRKNRISSAEILKRQVVKMRPELIEFNNGMPVRAFARSGNQYPYHWHDALEIIQVLKGSVNIGMGDDDLLLQEGDIAVTNMGEIHRMAGDGEEEILFIHIDNDFCRRVLPDHYLFIYCCSPYHEAQAPEKYNVLKEYIARLAVMLGAGPRITDQNTVEKLLKEMLIYTTYNFDFIRWGYGTEPFDEKRVSRLRQMAKHTTSDAEVQMGLTALAAELGISAQHLSGDIRKKFGMTFQELLCYSRCEHAARLLLGTDRRIVEIAADCGFSDNKYLIKYFKRFFRSTPSDFRKAYQLDGTTLALQTQYRVMSFDYALRRLPLVGARDSRE